MGPWHWRMLLPIALLGPIRFLGGTADALRWAHYIGRCYCRLLHFGPLYFWKALPIHSDGPITSAESASDCFDLVHYFSGSTSDALRWAHCISGCCCQWLCFGPLFCSEALLIHSDGPIALADAANNCFAWAHQISGRHFGWAHCISRCCYRLLCFGPIYFWEALPMHLHGPIALSDAAPDCFGFAPYISARHF